MWYLKCLKDNQIYFLLTGRQHLIGRKDVDLILPNDQSISRKHAILEVEHKSQNWSNPSAHPQVTIIEAGSKYGTKINPKDNHDCSLLPNSRHILKDGDVIQFGLQWNSWTLVYDPLVVCVSALTSEEKRNMKAIIAKLGGHVIDSWSPACTHLTMTNITLTVKAICALVYGKPITTPQFWDNYLIAAEKCTSLPNYENFIPPLAETVMKGDEVSFKINKGRESLFKGKKFIFFTKQQFNQIGCAISGAGGKAVCLEESMLPKEQLISSDVIVIQYTPERNSQPSQLPNSFIGYIDYIKSMGRRIVPVSEIGLAIAYCSVEKYCNPSFNFGSALLKSKKHITSQNTNDSVLAMDTQEADALCSRKTQKMIYAGKVIPESGTVSKKKDIETTKDDKGYSCSLTMDMAKFGSTSPTINQNKPSTSTINNFFKKVDIISPNKSHKRLSEMDDNKTPSKKPRFLIKPKIDDEEEEDLFSFASDKLEKKVSPQNIKNSEDLFSFADDITSAQIIASVPETTRKRLNSSEGDDVMEKIHVSKVMKMSPRSPEQNKDANLYKDSQDSKGFLSRKGNTLSDNEDKKQMNASNASIAFKDMIRKSFEDKVDHAIVQNAATINFKKFKKVKNPYQQVLPHIIAHQDMALFESKLDESCKWFNEIKVDDNSDKEDDIWAFSTQSNTSKRTVKGRSKKV